MSSSAASATRRLRGLRGLANSGAVGLLLLLLPTVVAQDPYYMSVLANIMMFSVPAVGAWLLIQSGLYSFGQGMFASLGAYTATILVQRTDMSFWLSGALAGAGAAIVACALAYPFLRTKAITFSVLTLVALLATDQVIMVLEDLTGGGAGLVAPPPGAIVVGGATIDFNEPTTRYYIVVALLLLFLATVSRLSRSRFIWTLRAADQSESLALSLGIDVKAYRTRVFVVAALFTGLAGAFSSAYLQVAHPKVWGLFPSIFIVTYAILGGRQAVVGPLVGAAFVIGGTALLPGLEEYQPIAVGLALIVIVIFSTGGLASLPGLAKRLVSREVGATGRRAVARLTSFRPSTDDRDDVSDGGRIYSERQSGGPGVEEEMRYDG